MAPPDSDPSADPDVEPGIEPGGRAADRPQTGAPTAAGGSRPRAAATGGFPWAGLLALIAVLALDAWLGSPAGPWDRAVERLPGGTRDILGGLAASRVSWRRFDAPPGDARPRVVLMGSSRGEAAWRDAEPAPEALLPDVVWVHDAHPGIEPFQLRSRVASLVDARPDVVVLLLSAFDTHRAVRLVHRANGDDTGAVFELAAALGPVVAWRERTALLRFGVASLLDSYRLREVWRRSGLGEVCSFEVGRGAAWRREPEWPVAISRGAGRAMTPAQFVSVQASLREGIPRLAEREDFLQQQLGVLQAITVGEHADVHLGLVRGTVERLAGAGIDVVLLEGPLCPLPVAVHDESPGLEFARLARELAERPEVWFVPVADSGPFDVGDFRDLVHVNAKGATKLSAATARAVEAALQRREK